MCFRYFAQGFTAARRVLDGVTRDLVGLADRLGRAITRDDLDAACEQDPTANAALGATRSALRPILPTRSAVLVIRDGGRPAYRVLDGLLASAEWLYSFHVDMVQRHAAAFPTPPGALRCLLEQALGTLWWGQCPVHGPPVLTLYTVAVRCAAVFPSSRHLLATYSRAGAQSQLSIRARRFLRALLQLRECPAHVWAYTLCAELLRAQRRYVLPLRSACFCVCAMSDHQVYPWLCSFVAQQSRGSDRSNVPTHQLRRLFEGAVGDAAGRSVVLFWRWYIRFELACGSPNRAKRVYLRAVARCV